MILLIGMPPPVYSFLERAAAFLDVGYDYNRNVSPPLYFFYIRHSPPFVSIFFKRE